MLNHHHIASYGNRLLKLTIISMNEIINCPFCKKDIWTSVFDETDHFLAIYNLSPILPGHSMVIPRRHYTEMMELPEDLFIEMMTFSRQVVKLLSQAFNTSAFDWTVQEKEPAGQTIDHLHLHIIPRKDGDLESPGAWYPELMHSESQPIDSKDRPKLSIKEMTERVCYIRQFKSSKKED